MEISVDSDSKTNGDVAPGGGVHAKTNGTPTAAMGTEVGAGPDHVAEASSYFTTKRDAAVKLRMEPGGAASAKPVSLPTIMMDRARTYPNRPALCDKRDGKWVTWTYAEYLDTVRNTAKAFIKLGLEPYHGVGIIGFNSPEWFFSDVGAIFAGAFAVGVYTTNSPEACHYVLENADCNIVVVENDTQLKKILAVRDRLPTIKAIIQYKGEPSVQDPMIHKWSDIVKIGKDVPDSVLEERLKAQAPNKCCTLIYTSGTTGNPKGVMLSHDNVTWTTRQVVAMLDKFLQHGGGTEHLISYLPLSHIAAQIIDIYAPMYLAGTVHFAQPDALKGSLAATIKEVRPTMFLGVPRVWEKIMEKMLEVGRQSSGLKKKIALWAKGVGLRGNEARQNGESVPWGWTLANALVFRKVRATLGLDRCTICATAAAPIMKETLDFFSSLDISLMEIYGMSESSGPHTVSVPDEYCSGAVGKEFPGATTKLDNKDKDGNGEICMFGRHVFMGYLDRPEKTDEATDSDGYLHSGDVGRYKNGFMFITGRIKEILITAGGENVAPVPIEDNIKEELPVVSNAMVIGDKKKFLAVLLTIKCEMDPDSGDALDKLAPPARDWLAKHGAPKIDTVSELRSKLNGECASIMKALQEGVDRANKRAVSRAQNVQKWTILPKDFSIPGGELGPTLKVRRPIIVKMYQETIEKFYESKS